jgi:hypothetical protein
VELLERALASSALVVAIDPGKVSNRVWLASGAQGLVAEPVSLPVLREGIEALDRMIAASGIPGRR